MFLFCRIPYNLNAISHDTAIALVEKALEDNVKVEKVYVDTVGDPARYEVRKSRQSRSLTLFYGMLLDIDRKSWTNTSEER